VALHDKASTIDDANLLQKHSTARHCIQTKSLGLIRKALPLVFSRAASEWSMKKDDWLLHASLISPHGSVAVNAHPMFAVPRPAGQKLLDHWRHARCRNDRNNGMALTRGTK
jgi:hypothetical protein